MTRTIADALEERLRSLGVQRVYGQPLANLQQVPVSNPDLAVLLADADGRLGHHDGSGRLGAALLDGPILHLSSSPGGLAPLQRVSSAVELLDALVDPPGMLLPGTLALHLDLDLNEVVPEGLAPGRSGDPDGGSRQRSHQDGDHGPHARVHPDCGGRCARNAG